MREFTFPGHCADMAEMLTMVRRVPPGAGFVCSGMAAQAMCEILAEFLDREDLKFSVEGVKTRVEYQLWSNISERADRFINGWREGDCMRMTHEGDLNTVAPTSMVLEEIFRQLNADDRPNAAVAHSMSVGDVVVLWDDAGNT